MLDVMMMRNVQRLIHEQVSRRVLLPLMRFQQTVRPTRAPVNRAFREGMAFRSVTSQWNDDQKREWILTRLRFSVRRAFRETLYYRELFERIGFDPQADFSFEEFARLPVLDRDTIHQVGRALVTTAVPMSQLKRDSTGGSTGIPTEIWLGSEEEGWNESGREYFMRQVGLPVGTSLGMLWGHHLDPIANDHFIDRVSAFAHNIRWFDCFRMSPETLEQYHAEFERLRPTGIVAYASALSQLADHILERGYKPRYPICSLVTGAEKLLPACREKIEAAFAGRSVHERYGSRDAGLIGFQLTPGETLEYAVDWANVFVEPENDEPNAPILVTKLHADGMPMIRYRIGDAARFPNGSRPGYPCLLLPEVLGRMTDRVWLPNGRWISGNQFPHLLKDYPVREFMFLQRADYTVQLKIVPQKNFSAESRRAIEQAVSANLPGLDLRLELVDNIPRTKANKWRPVATEVLMGRDHA